LAKIKLLLEIIRIEFNFLKYVFIFQFLNSWDDVQLLNYLGLSIFYILALPIISLINYCIGQLNEYSNPEKI